MDENKPAGDPSENDNVPPWQRDQEGSEPSVGAWLKHQREMRSIQLREIADHTRISPRFLEAIEENDHQVLPATVFVRGFLRQYARFVGLEETEVLARYEAEGGEDAKNEAAGEADGSSDWRWGVFVAASIVVLAGAAYWAYARGSDGAGGSPSELPVAEPAAVEQAADEAGRNEPSYGLDGDDGSVAEATGEAPPESDGDELAAIGGGTGSNDRAQGAGEDGQIAADLAPIRLTVDFVEDCWVEHSIDGVRQLSTIYAKGESLRVEAEERVDLRLGNYPGAVVEINGRSYQWPQAATRSRTRELVIDSAFVAAFLDEGSGDGTTVS